jgi:hypothetical protein
MLWQWPEILEDGDNELPDLYRPTLNLLGISKRVANRRLRAVLIQGARAYVYHMKEPKTARSRRLAKCIRPLY